MRDIVTDREYRIDGDELVEVVTIRTPLDGELDVWNLRSLVKVTAIDKFHLTRVCLLFADGSRLVAEVDKDEYALLKVRVESGETRLERHPVRKKRPLTVTEKENALLIRKKGDFPAIVVSLCMLAMALAAA